MTVMFKQDFTKTKQLSDKLISVNVMFSISQLYRNINVEYNQFCVAQLLG